MKVKKLFSAILVASCATSAFANTTAHLDLLSKLKTKNKIELLFFQQAQSGSIKESSSGCYDLVLSHLDHDVMYFSDSPSKAAGNLTLTQLAESMRHSQMVDKVIPNAVLNIKLGSGKTTHSLNMVGSLSNAMYAKNEFHYHFCPFEGKQIIREGKIRSINLFIDPIHRWPP